MPLLSDAKLFRRRLPAQSQSDWLSKSYGSLAYKRSRNAARHSLQSFFLGTPLGRWVVLVIVGSLLIVSGALALTLTCTITSRNWRSSTGLESCAGGAETYTEALWLSWGLFFDPGTQTGIGVQEPPVFIIVAVIFSVAGFIFNLMVLGLIVEGVHYFISKKEEKYASVIANNHAVVLGWTEKTLWLAGELAQMLTETKGSGTIVLLGRCEALMMKESLALAFPEWRQRWPRVHVEYRQGHPAYGDDLMRISLFSARWIFLLGSGRRPNAADSQVLSTLFGISCLPTVSALTSKTKVIADLCSVHNKPVATHIGARGGTTADRGGLNVHPVETSAKLDSALVLCATSPSAGHAMLDLMEFDGMQFELLPAAPYAPAKFGSLARLLPDRLTLVGVVRGGARAEERGGAAAADGEKGKKDGGDERTRLGSLSLSSVGALFNNATEAFMEELTKLGETALHGAQGTHAQLCANARPGPHTTCMVSHCTCALLLPPVISLYLP